MNLTEFSYYARKYGPLLALSIIFFLLLIYTIYLFSLTSQTTVKKTLYTNPVFGKLLLPKIKSLHIDKKISFELDTIEGVPTTATLSATIYPFIKPKTKLTYLERIYLMAKKLGFDTTKASYTREGNLAYFKDEQKTVVIDITNYNFKFFFSQEWILENIDSFLLPKNDFALQFAKETLASLNKYPKDLAQGKNNISFLNLRETDPKKQIVNSPLQAQAIRIDFYRKEDTLPIVNPAFPKSQNFAVITVSQGQPLLLEAQIKFYEIDKTKQGIYPLITGDEAWQKLKKYQAFFLKLPETLPQTIYVKKMFLAYYDPEEFTPYFLPFYVFLGKDFIAYVPAVKEEFLQY